MSQLQDIFANVLGNAFHYIALAALIVGCVLIIAALSNIIGEQKQLGKFVLNLAIGGLLIYLYLWLTKPLGLFGGTQFSQ